MEIMTADMPRAPEGHECCVCSDRAPGPLKGTRTRATPLKASRIRSSRQDIGMEIVLNSRRRLMKKNRQTRTMQTNVPTSCRESHARCCPEGPNDAAEAGAGHPRAHQ